MARRQLYNVQSFSDTLRERIFSKNKKWHVRGEIQRQRLQLQSRQKPPSFTTSPLLMNSADRTAFGRVEEAVRLTRYGGDCYSYCMLAAGHLDLVVETELKPYDIAALIPIVTGAGGIVTTWDGKPAQSGGRIIAAGDARVHEAAMKLLNG